MYPIPPQVLDHLADANHRGGPWDGAKCIVLHHTGGTNSLKWLSSTSHPPVSVQRLIIKTGLIYRIVPDGEQAYHVGRSNIGRHTTASGDLGSASEIALGIEFENLGNGKDPYPEAQRDAGAWQIARWWRDYGWLPVLTHGLIDSTGKTDPVGLDVVDVMRRTMLWYDRMVSAPPPRAGPYTVDSPLLGAPLGTLGDVVAAFPAPAKVPEGRYNQYDIQRVILPAYFEQCAMIGLDPIVAIAQMARETGNLTSFWSLRPQRNPAGIGVTGDSKPPEQLHPYPPELWRLNTQRHRWERGNSFSDWQQESIPAHIGRLLAYALTDDEATPVQRTVIDYALSVRRLDPTVVRGSVKTLQGLEGTWADPGVTYADKLAEKANQLVGI